MEKEIAEGEGRLLSETRFQRPWVLRPFPPAGHFIEYAHVHGNIYGTSKKAVQSVLDAGKALGFSRASPSSYRPVPSSPRQVLHLGHRRPGRPGRPQERHQGHLCLHRAPIVRGSRAAPPGQGNGGLKATIVRRPLRQPHVPPPPPPPHSGFAQETEEKIQLRLGNAKAEIDAANEPGLFDHRIVNDSVDACVERLRVFAERARK